jgi:NADP-dependent 3-hydroxy acid dehydrogenase YdfG
MKDTLALGLEEKHALVCASSSGIGKAIAEKFKFFSFGESSLLTRGSV